MIYNWYVFGFVIFTVNISRLENAIFETGGSKMVAEKKEEVMV